MKLTTLQPHKPNQSLPLIKLLLVSCFVCLSSYIHAQDTLFFEDFNREMSSTGCPTEIDFQINEMSLNFPDPNYYDKYYCNDSSVTVLAGESYGANLFTSNFFEDSSLKFGDILKISFDLIPLDEENNFFYGYGFVLQNADTLYKEIGFDFDEYGKITGKHRFSYETELGSKSWATRSTIPGILKMYISMNGDFLLDNLLITADIVTSTPINDIGKSDSVLFYYSLQGEKMVLPAGGQLLIAVFESGNRKKVFFN